MYSNFELVGLYCALNRRIISNSFCDCDIGDENKQDIGIFQIKIQKSEKSVNIGYVPRQCIANNVGENMNAPYYISFEIERNDNNLVKMGYVIQQVHLYLRTIGIGSFGVFQIELTKYIKKEHTILIHVKIELVITQINRRWLYVP